MQVLVARIGRPHGLKGEVTVQVHTDSPQERFIVGARLATASTTAARAAALTLRSVRVHNGTMLLGFEEATDRTAAEALRGTRLFVQRDQPAGFGPGDPGASSDSGEILDPGDSDEIVQDGWYEDELLGLAVETVSGESVGEVVGLLTRPAQDLLVVRLRTGQESLVPFVDEIVPQVDPEAGRVVIDPPPGLLDLAGE